MVSEESPLLPNTPPDDNDLVYQRFSPLYKKVIVAIVSWCALLPLFISGTFIPSIPQIAKDLQTTGQFVSLTVSISVLSASIGALAAASYSTFYGRRRVYLVLQPMSVIGSFGVATAQNMPQLLFWRIWQCAGASPGLVVGAGVIGDIYKLEERGTAMGWFLAGSLLGPALAPPVGGFVAHYASWRFMQLCLGIAGLLLFAVMFFVFPETCHPGTRGIDKLRLTGNARHSWRHVNPLRPLTLLRAPTITIVSIIGLLVLLTDYVLLIPLAYTIGKRYHLDHNEALVGACFLPSGIGNMVGAAMAGRLSDKIIVYWKKKRNGKWYPEDRLRATFSGGLFLVPLSVLGCGLATEYVEGPIGLALNLLFLFMNGLGVDVVLNPMATYVVDILHSRSAEAMACHSGFRTFLLTFAIAGVLPMVDTYGMLMTNFVSACLALVGFVLTLVTVRYGDQMRAWTDIEYSTAVDVN